MGSSTPRLIAFTLAGLFVATHATAQTPQRAPVATFDELATLLAPGTTVIVTDTKGLEVKGRLSAINGKSLSLLSEGRTQSFGLPDVSEVQQQMPDSILNGALIGLAVGFVLPAVICTSGSDASETAPCVAGAFLLGGLPGLGIGLGIDAVRTRKVTLFRSSGGAPNTLTIVPVMGPGRIELRASVRLGKGGSWESRHDR